MDEGAAAPRDHRPERSTSRRSAPRSRSRASSGATARGTSCSSGSGERRIRRNALEEIFSSLQKSGPGLHSIPRAGTGTETLPETRPYEFGDDVARLDGIRTVANAARRDPDDLALRPDDFEVFDVEHQSACATAIAIDISHSMILYGEDRFTPAKKVALALTELILQKYPKDTIDIVLFGDEARSVPLEELSQGAGRAVPHEHEGGARRSRGSSSCGAARATGRSS